MFESRGEVAESERGSEALSLVLVLAAWPTEWMLHPHLHCVHHGKAGLHSTCSQDSFGVPRPHQHAAPPLSCVLSLRKACPSRWGRGTEEE